VQVFRLQAAICKTLADANRLMILYELKDGERSVGRLAAELGLSQSNVSRHLSVLREQGVVDSCRNGTSIYYSLSDPKITEACRIMRDILERRLARSYRMTVNLKSVKDLGYHVTIEESL
jgi:DNA-binding transcriptional ArsR family regulator